MTTGAMPAWVEASESPNGGLGFPCHSGKGAVEIHLDRRRLSI